MAEPMILVVLAVSSVVEAETVFGLAHIDESHPGL